ncbi:hypothetical protein GCM10027174_44560 [Salinifilum aidingensis]
MSDTFTTLTTILTDQFEVLSDDIAPDKTLEDLGVDSVATVELADILKETFGVTVGEDELTSRNTLDQVLALITTKAGA